MRAFLLVAVSGVVWSPPASCFQDDPPGTSASVKLEEVISRMGEMDRARASSLRDYSSVRRYSLENRRFGTKAEITARMNYDQSGKKTFEILSEKGSGIIRKRVLRRMIQEEQDANREAVRAATRITPENYTFRLVGSEPQQGRPCYVLEAVPKRRHKHLLRGRIWVDEEDAAIVRIEGAPAEKPSFLVRKTTFVHTYGRFGQFWLPVGNQSSSDVLIYGHTVVTIDYFDYLVNGSRPAMLEDKLAAPSANGSGQDVRSREGGASKP